MAFRADPERINQAANRISGWADDFQKDTIDLIRRVDELFEDGWKGAAADTHAKLWAEWSDGARRVVSRCRVTAGCCTRVVSRRPRGSGARSEHRRKQFRGLSMDRYVVDLARLREVIETGVLIGKRIDERLLDVDREVASLGDIWTGEAADAHRERHAEWMQGARDMHAALSELASSVQHAHNVFRNAVAHNEGMWP